MPLDYLRKVEKRDAQQQQSHGAASSRPERRVSAARSSSSSSASAAGGISLFKAVSFALVAIVILPAVIYLPWILALLRPTQNLPDFWVQPSIKLPSPSAAAAAVGADVDLEQLGEPNCLNAKVSAIDPYHRSQPYHEWDRTVQKTEFCEDAEILHTRGLVFVSCDPGRHEWNTVMGPLKNPNPRGALWVYDFSASVAAANSSAAFSTPPAEALEIVHLLNYPERLDFHPLGISIFDPSESHGGVGTNDDSNDSLSSPLRLFVVNHQRARSSIEVFDLEKQARGWVASYVRSIVDPISTHTPNSVQALSRDTFLVTQDHLFARRTSPSGQLVQTFAQALPFPSLISSLVAPVFARVSSPRSLSAILAPIETFLGLPLAWVSYVQFDAEAGKLDTSHRPESAAAAALQEALDAKTASRGLVSNIVASGIPFANGLALSPRGSTLAVASSTHPGVFLYDVGPPPPPPFGKKSSYSGSKASNVKPRLNWSKREHVRLREKVHAPFVVDNVSFGPIQPSAPAAASVDPTTRSSNKKPLNADPFDSSPLILAGHPDTFGLFRLSHSPHDGRTAPSWVISLRPSQAYQQGQEKFGLSSLITNLEHDRDAPVQANRRVLTHDPHWRLTSLFQSTGEKVDVRIQTETEGQGAWREVQLPSSCTAVWNGGFMMVTGLYAKGLLVCSNVAREVV